MLLNHLAAADRHIAQGDQHLRRQRLVVASLKRLYPGSERLKQALAMLANMERKQRDHIAERDRLRQKLDGQP
jgi:hypothetical protein